MKTIITTLLLVFFSSCITLQAQNIISGTFAGNDLQVGLRYDAQFNQKWGMYSGVGYGNYMALSCGQIEHVRLSGGVTRYAINYAEPDWLTYFSFGLGAHHYNQITEGYEPVPKIALYPVSIELGVGFIVSKRFCVGWTYDPFKRDGVINVGYRFGLK